jgi:N-acetylmuramoyl-L-alanine amidase
MRKYLLATWVIGTALIVGPALATDDGDVIADTTSQYNQAEQTAEEKLAQTSFFSALQPFGFGAQVASLQDLKSPMKIINMGPGDPKKTYDIIIQPGHYGRTTGRTGTSGPNISEQQLVAYIAGKLAEYLQSQKVNFLVIPADDFDKSGLKSQIFLAIHADGSDPPNECKGGPSLGYAQGSSLLGLHAIGFALATSEGQQYADFMKDNFTVNEHHYYAFNYISAKGYSGLLEVGVLSCPAIEKKLIATANLIAFNLGVALKASLDILKEPLTSP